MRALLLSLALATPLSAAAERVALLPATGSNVHEAYLASATDVLRSYLERTGKFEVAIVPSPAAPGAEATWSQAAEAARAVGAELAVTLRIARLGAGGQVRLAAFRTDGSVYQTDELSAATPEDLDTVLRRLADGLAAGRPAREVAQIDSVTQKEATPYLKQEATNVFGLRLGGVYVMNRASADGEEGVAGGGIFWLYDARSYLAEVTFDIMGNNGGDNLVSLGLGAYYPFLRGNTSPYIGGGLAYTWIETGEGASGLGIRVGGGLLFGRLSTVQLRADFGWWLNTYQESSVSSDLANGPYLTVGVGF
jgi:hypothetical protein